MRVYAHALTGWTSAPTAFTGWIDGLLIGPLLGLMLLSLPLEDLLR